MEHQHRRTLFGQIFVDLLAVALVELESVQLELEFRSKSRIDARIDMERNLKRAALEIDLCDKKILVGQCLEIGMDQPRPMRRALARDDGALGIVTRTATRQDRKSVVEGKSVSVRVDLGGRRIIKKKIQSKNRKRNRKD